MYMAWFKPPLQNPDSISLEMLASILADGQDSLLIQRLVNEKKLATSINIYTGFPGERFTNLFFISAVPSPDVSYDELQSAILDVIADVQKNGVDQQRLQRVQKKALSDFAFSLRDPARLADLLSYYQLLTGDFHTLFRSYERMNHIQTSEIQDVASRYLKPEWLMQARLLPAE